MPPYTQYRVNVWQTLCALLVPSLKLIQYILSTNPIEEMGNLVTLMTKS